MQPNANAVRKTRAEQPNTPQVRHDGHVPTRPTVPPEATREEAGLLSRAEAVAKLEMANQTLTEWIRAGEITPMFDVRNGRRIRQFSPRQVERLRAIRRILKQHRGQLSRRAAALIVDGEADRPEEPHNPARPFPLTPPLHDYVKVLKARS